jgi:comEA protein
MNNLWTKTESITIALLISLGVIICALTYPATKLSPALFKQPSDFFRIDINQASWEELDLLPAIGPKRAKDIIEYRNTHGPFKDINELNQVSGIADKTIDRIKDKVTY